MIGWTWYTGSANWLYRAGLEHILGFKKRGNRIYLSPCIPNDWDGFSIKYQFGQSTYIFEVKNKAFDTDYSLKITFDDVNIIQSFVELIDDGKKHIACVELI